MSAAQRTAAAVPAASRLYLPTSELSYRPDVEVYAAARRTVVLLGLVDNAFATLYAGAAPTSALALESAERVRAEAAAALPPPPAGIAADALGRGHRLQWAAFDEPGRYALRVWSSDGLAVDAVVVGSPERCLATMARELRGSGQAGA